MYRKYLPNCVILMTVWYAFHDICFKRWCKAKIKSNYMKYLFSRRRRKQKTEKEWSKRKRQYYFRDTFSEITFLHFAICVFTHIIFIAFFIKAGYLFTSLLFFLQVSLPNLFIISLIFYSLRLLLMDIYACFVMKSDVFDFIISNHFEYSYWRFSLILKCRFISVFGFAVFRRILQEFFHLQ